MARIILVLSSFLAFYAISRLVSGYSEYGCYSNTPSQDFFYKNPGNYNISTLTPILCAQLCAKISCPYAALQVVASQPICYCSSTIMLVPKSPTYIGRCTDFCLGNQSLSCGGINYATMYSTDGYLRQLEIDQPLQTNIMTASSLTFQFSSIYYANPGLAATLKADYGDGWITPSITPFLQINHLYTGIGPIKFTATFHNNLTRNLQAVRHYHLHAPVVITDTQCPIDVRKNQLFWCKAIVSSGNEMNVIVSFGDGNSIEFPILDCRHTYLGEIAAVQTAPILGIRDDPDEATLLFPHYVIKRSGYIHHWEGSFKQTGKIQFQVWRPSCPDGIYCHLLGRCISRSDHCQPPLCENFHRNISYCFSSGNCYNQTDCNASNYSNPFDLSMAILVGQTEGFIYNTGRAVLSEPHITPLAVQEGDFIGIAYSGSDSGEITVVHDEFSTTVYFSPNSQTDIGSAFDSTNVSSYQDHYLIRAVVVEPSIIGPFTYNYSTAGVQTINITAYNSNSSSISIADIEVKEDIEGVTIQVYDNATHQVGNGSDLNYFAVNQTLAIIISTEYGSPTNYSYNLGAQGTVLSVSGIDTGNNNQTLKVENETTVPSTTNKSSIEIIYIYNASGVANITVNASNTYSWAIGSSQLVLYYPIQILFVYAPSYRITVGEPLEVFVFLKQIGNSSAIVWDPQDGTPAITRNGSEAVLASTVPKIANKSSRFEFQLNSTYVMIFNHIYYKVKSYNLRIQAINLVTNYTIFQRVRVRKCSPLSVSFTFSGGRTKSRPKVFSISRYILLSSNLTVRCNLTGGVYFNWTLTPYKLIDGDAIESPPLQFPPTILTNTSILIVPNRIISSAYNYKIYLRVTSHNKSFTDDVGAYLSFRNNPLVAHIIGGNYRTVGFNQSIIMDASRSCDPDDVKNNYGNITYYWTCQIINHQSQLRTTVHSCLNLTSQQAQQPILYIPPSILVSNSTYLFQVIIKKDVRESVGAQLVYITLHDPPNIEIICKRNCMNKVNPSDSFILEGRCKGRCDNLTYSWSLLNTTLKWNTISSTGNNKEYITFLSNTFLNKTEYTIQLAVSRLNGSVSYSYYNISINPPPKPGTCHVEPSDGITLKTMYSIRCYDFSDDDQPLSYQFRIPSASTVNNEMEVYYSPVPKVSLILPAGQESNGYKLPMEVIATDGLGASVKIPILITVRPFSNYTSEEELSMVNNFTKGNISVLRQFIDQGKLQEANLAIGISASILNRLSSKDSPLTFMNILDSTVGSEDGQKRTIIRALLVNDVLTNNMIQTLPLLKQTVDAILPITEVKQELADMTQGMISTSLQHMTAILNFEGQNGADDALLKSTAKGIVKVANNIIAAAKYMQQSAGINQPTTSPTASKMSDIISRSVLAIHSSCTVMLMNKVPGEIPSTITSDAINVTLSRHTYHELPQEIGEPQLSTFKLPKAEFLIPNIGNMIQSNGDPIFVDYRWSTLKNPYTYVSSSANIANDINGLSLTFDNGSEISVKNLQHPINIQLPQTYSDTEAIANRTIHQATRFYVQCSAYRCQNPKHYFDILSISDVRGFIIQTDQPLQAIVQSITSTNITHVIANYSVHNIHTSIAYNLISSNSFQPGRYVLELQYQIPLLYGNKSSRNFYFANYSLAFYDLGCRFWNHTTSEWSSSGCKMISNSNHNDGIYCQCNHLTFFAGRFDVTPNILDFTKIQHWFANIHNNPYIIIVLACLYVIFIVISVWAWRQDKKNAVKFSNTVLIDNRPDDLYHYEITVFTGLRVGSGTTANVSLIISGENQDTSPRLLKDFNRPLLQTRDIDTMILTCSQDLGSINYIRLYHDNSGLSPSWFLSRIIIKDLQTNEQYCFICNKWLAVDAEDGLIDRTLYPATTEELRDFMQSFMSKAAISLSDNHIWLSIVTRPVKSHFTRLQRVGCCFAILLLSMLTNAMFYRNDIETQDSAGTIFIGKIITWDGLVRGLISGAIVFLPSFMMVQFFRLSRPKPTKQGNSNHLEQQNKPARPIVRKESTKVKLIRCRTGEQSDQSCNKLQSFDDSEEKGCFKLDISLPWWCLYLGWGLIVISCGVGTAFTLFYGLSFGSELCLQWLASLTISILQSILILQPIKVVVVAFIFALIVRRPDLGVDINKMEDNMDDTMSTAINVKDIHPDAQRYTSSKFLPLEVSKVNAARSLRLKQRKMQSIFREILGYVVFLTVTILICYGNRDSNAYYQTKSLNDIFANGYYNSNTSKIGSPLKGFAKIATINEFWRWTNQVFLPGLYVGTWYNGQSSNLQGFLANRQSYLVGVARVRMLRMNTGDNCLINPVFNNTILKCAGSYFYGSENRNNYTVGWKSISHSPQQNPWHFQTSSMTGSYPYWGQYHIYYGGGYVVELSRNESQSQLTLNQLQQQGWIDHQTRAILIEFTIFNAQVNLFSVVTLLAEFPATGGIMPFVEIQTIRLFRDHYSAGMLVIVCEIIFVSFIAYYIYRELSKLKRLSLRYFSGFWNIIEFTIISLAVAAVSIYFFRLQVTRNALAQCRSQSRHFINFHYVATWDNLYIHLFAFLIFFGTIKLIRLLRFNRTIAILSITLRSAAKEILMFLVVFTVIFLTFAQFAYLIYGRTINSYNTFIKTLESQFNMMIGRFYAKIMYSSLRDVSPLYFFCYTFLVSWVLINMFLTLIIKSFEKVKSCCNQINQDLEMADYMKERFKSLVGKKSFKTTDHSDHPCALSQQQLHRRYTIVQNQLDDILVCVNRINAKRK
ncbi:uncharacterized protein TRIADDRAFT_53596 [Trichoplax adhaerens]|uniref:GPS domain-containing protein n=1 Tax=Trichoplax adhaerens TaxID=10228 RepID=B3RPM8_TRIAD|nr:hypothetical protein TRIADDRAFT_53596 [Trichoplax adhaerens]EDV28218.1 hypothetical protein TRIADDRAFT_53596 [Trichoplax adhaerens]|eukprot:XP_002110052.1 hypothetical protein TRIADDRAFT_53596 [Trichoplax adhaerens]